MVGFEVSMEIDHRVDTFRQEVEDAFNWMLERIVELEAKVEALERDQRRVTPDSRQNSIGSKRWDPPDMQPVVIDHTTKMVKILQKDANGNS